MALRAGPTSKIPKTFQADAEITASVAIDLNNRSDQRYLRSTVAHSRNTGRAPWQWFHKIGEVHYAISRSARIAGYGRLNLVRLGADGRVEEEITTGPEAEIVSEIASPYGGVRGLIERWYTLQKVPGDSYLIRLRDDDGDIAGYHFASPSELDVGSFASWRPGSGQLRWVTLPATSGGSDADRFVRPLRSEDLLGRVWRPDPEYVDLADSALQALENECESLLLLTQSVKAKLRSRLASAGILFIPSGLSTARVRRGQQNVAGQNIDDTLNFLITAMTHNQRNWEDASAWLPILLQGAPGLGKEIQHITFDREVFETDLKLRAELINRIFQGLDSNQDQTKGTSDQSHWGAWAAADEERRVAVQPDLRMLTWALTRLVLHRRLAEIGGRTPEDILRYRIDFDLSEAAVKSNQQEDARQALDRGQISDDAYLRLTGFDAKDQISGDERVRWAGRITRNPVLMLHGLPEAETVDWEKASQFPGSRGPGAKSDADDPESGPGEGEPGSPDDRETDEPRSQRPA